MIDLKTYLSLNIQYNNQNNKLFYNNDTVISKTGERKLEEMTDVVLNDNLTCPSVVYQVAQGISKIKDQDKWKQLGLRYDMTIMPPNFIGIEYVKTVGHYHDILEGSSYPAPEALEIIYGSGIVILQKPQKSDQPADKYSTIKDLYDFSLIKDLYLIKVSKGDKIVIPPGFAHVIVNTKNMPLIIGNIQSVKVKHVYDPIRAQHGFAYYIIHKNARLEIVQNPHYKILGNINKIKLKDFKVPVKLKSTKSLYKMVLSNPEKVEWLKHPEMVKWDE